MNEQKHYEIPSECERCGKQPPTYCSTGEKKDNGELCRPEFLCGLCGKELYNLIPDPGVITRYS